jgi:phosphoglycolate phosphatase
MQKFVAKAILIDLDGTLVDTAPEIARAANQMLVDLGYESQSAVQITGFIGEGAVALISKCLKAATNDEPSEALLVKAKSSFFAHYRAILTQSVPYDGVVDSVKKLHATGFKLACITNKPQAFTTVLLDKIGLLPLFDEVVCGDTLPQKKPDPAPLIYACTQLGVTINDAVMIGDSRTDITAARHAACAVFAVVNGYTQGKPILANEVDVLLAKLSDVHQHVLMKT